MYFTPATASAVHTPLSSRDIDVPELVASSGLFYGLERSVCVQIAQCARLRKYSRDEFIFEQGQPLRHVFVVVSGSIKMTQLNSDGSEVILWLCGPGDAVGVLGIHSLSKHTCSARIIVKCRALVWDWSKLTEHPASSQIRENVSRITSERIVELEARFREIATEKVAVRVALCLLRIRKQVGKSSSDGVEIFLSREELAQLTGTTLFTVSRLMTRWREQGIIEPRREAILIRDPIRLLETCDVDDIKSRNRFPLPGSGRPLSMLPGLTECSGRV